MIQIERRVGYAPSVSTEFGSLIRPRWHRTERRGVLFCHMFGATSSIIYDPLYGAPAWRMGEADMLVFAGDFAGANNWGNEDSIDRMDDGYQYLLDHGAIDGPVGIASYSMGTHQALIWAARNPDKVSAIALMLPTPGLQVCHDSYPAQFAFAIDLAYTDHAGFLAALPDHDYTNVIAALDGIPIRIYADRHDDFYRGEVESGAPSFPAHYSYILDQVASADMETFNGEGHTLDNLDPERPAVFLWSGGTAPVAVAPETPEPIELAEGRWEPVLTPRAFDTAYQNATASTIAVSMAGGVASQGGQGGRIVLETCPDAGFGANTHVLDTAGSESGVGGNEVELGSGMLGLIPPGHRYRYRKLAIGSEPLTWAFNTGFEERLVLNGDRTDAEYVTAAYAGLETPRQNTEADPVWVCARAAIVCDPGDDGKVVLQVCPDNAFGAGTSEPSASRLKNHAGGVAAITLHEGLKAIVPPGYWWQWVPVDTAGTPTITIDSGEETTMVLSGVVCEENYDATTPPVITAARRNPDPDAWLVSVLGGQVSDPGDNGHLLLTVSPTAGDLAAHLWDIPYNATRNADLTGDDITHKSTMMAIVPGGHRWRYYSTISPGYTEPLQVLEGNEYALKLATGEFLP